jgi:hypothetical protein
MTLDGKMFCFACALTIRQLLEIIHYGRRKHLNISFIVVLLWKGNERNTGERMERDKGTKGINRRKRGGKRWRYERNHSPLNFNGPFPLVWAGVAQAVQCLTTDWTTEIRYPTGAEDFSSSLCVRTGSGAHPASCPMGTGCSFPGG